MDQALAVWFDAGTDLFPLFLAFCMIFMKEFGSLKRG